MLSVARLGRRVVAGAVFLVGFSALCASSAQAFTVTNLNDSGAGSLRQAIIDSNTRPGSDSITIDVVGTINIQSALPTLDNVVIVGKSATQNIVRRNSTDNFRIFTVPAGVNVGLGNITISNGKVGGFGGGVNNSGTLIVSDCRFTGNSAGGDGGALSNFHGTMIVSESQFSNNTASGNGGAIVSDARADEDGNSPGPASLGVGSCTFSGNGATLNGGAIANFEGAFNLEDSTLDGNSAAQLGGGIYTDSNTVNLTSSTLSGNNAGEGGGLYSTSATTLKNCTFSGNVAVRRGGGLSNADLLTVLDSCTFSSNKAPSGHGAGIVTVGDDGAATTRLTNSIVAGNLNSDGSAGTDLDYDGNKDSFVSGGYNILGVGNSNLRTGTDIISTSPEIGPLADNGGPTKTRALPPSSLAINHGNTSLNTDQRGVARPQGTRDDIGAVEYDGFVPSLVVTTLVDEDDGTSDPRYGTGTSLREAILFANSNPDSSTITFNLPGTGAKTINLTGALPSLSTAISIVGPGASVLTVKRNTTGAYRIFTPTYAGAISISGLTLSNGNTGKSLGGAILNTVSTLTLSNCAFSGNLALAGGAISNQPASSSDVSLIISGCSFLNNKNSDGDAGGAALYNPSGTVTIDSSTFSGNTVANGGGAIFNAGNVSLTNCTLSGNSSTNSGGAIYNFQKLSLTNCTLSANKAAVGAGIFNGGMDGSLVTLNNCTLSGNQASQGGAYYASAGKTQFDSCTLTANSANGGAGAGIFASGDSKTSTEIRNSIVAGNSDTDLDFGGNIQPINSFVSKGYNIVGDGNGVSAFTATGDQVDLSALDLKIGALANNGGPTFTHALLVGSPAINKGNTVLLVDQRGTKRPQGSADDIGAYEYATPKPASAPTLVKMVGPSGDTSTVAGNPAIASPQLNGQSGANEFVKFTTVVRDLDGNADLGKVVFTLGSGTGQLTLTYDATVNHLSASGPSGSSGAFVPGSANVLTVSTGALDCAGTKVTRSGTDITIMWNLKVTSTATVKRSLTLQATDKESLTSGALSFGNWTFTPAFSPEVVYVNSPSNTTATATGNPQTVSPLLSGQSAANTFVFFTTRVRDGNGNADLSKVSFLLGSGASELDLVYNPVNNLLNASGPNGASGSFAPGSANVLTVSTGALDCAGTTITRDGNNLTVRWKLKVTTASPVTQALRLRAQDKAGALSALVTFGSWTFAPAGNISAVSSNSGGGS